MNKAQEIWNYFLLVLMFFLVVPIRIPMWFAAGFAYRYQEWFYRSICGRRENPFEIFRRGIEAIERGKAKGWQQEKNM